MKALVHTDTVELLSSNQQRAWLFRTFKNLFFDRYRRALLEAEFLLSQETQYTEDPGIQEIETAMVLQSMPPKDRTIFQLRYFDGYSAAEIAQMLDMPPGTVRSRLSRCRTHLKQTLEK